jgi:hypothetical protein
MARLISSKSAAFRVMPIDKTRGETRVDFSSHSIEAFSSSSTLNLVSPARQIPVAFAGKS